MMKSMYSSFYNTEYINYRKYTSYDDRTLFIRAVKKSGNNLHIPIVVDSVDKNISLTLGGNENLLSRNLRYGKEYSMHKDIPCKEFLTLVKQDLPNISLRTEDTNELDLTLTVGQVYKKHKHEDYILYLLATREPTFYDYIKSILAYIKNTIYRGYDI